MSRQLRKIRWLSEDGLKVMTAEIGKDIEGDTSDDHPFGKGPVISIEETDQAVLVQASNRPLPISIANEEIRERKAIDEI
jgi:hypothetical protein